MRRASSVLLAIVLATATARAQGDAEITHPVAVHQVDATYPVELAPQHADVILIVTLDADGNVTDVKVETSGGIAFDAAATSAVRKWTFSPATKNGKPFAARMKIPFHFEPPKPPPPEPPPPEPTPPPPKPDVEKPVEPARIAPVVRDIEDVHVYATAPPPVVGAGDVQFRIGDLQRTRGAPRDNATKLLQSATPIFISNEGGEGHAEQIFMRGFDAREGLDIELSVGGIPINESGNVHGNGYADTHFIIPELVESVRVVEGPFDPRQGNYAVAGSADYELGLPRRGFIAKYTGGSWNTQRGLLLWGPEGMSDRTFVGAELYSTDGFGQNRDAVRGSAMAQYEGKLGERAIYHLTAAAYATHYHAAGLVRDDDYKAGKLGFYDSYDFQSYSHEAVPQGGDSSRFSISADLETRAGDTVLKQSVWFVQHDMRLLENFTGFILDPRGDELDTHVGSQMFGAKGSARFRARVFGQRQELEVGYFARADDVHSTQQRLEAATGTPYKTDTDIQSVLGDIGLYADANLHATRWLGLRGGVRSDLFTYDVLEANQRTSTATIGTMPRASLIVGPFAGLTFSVSAGTGIRSVDPGDVASTPLASILAFEGGATYTHTFRGDVTLVARSVFFQTKVDKEIVFDETLGQNVLGPATTRTGWVGAARLSGKHIGRTPINFDVSTNATLVKSEYDDTHALVAYVPNSVFHTDAVIYGDLPLRIAGTKIGASLGTGLTYVGRRPLPSGERSDDIFTLDAHAALSWRNFELGVTGTNLTNNQYRLGEYEYSSYFRAQPQATLVPSRMFTTGAPLGIFANVTIRFGGKS